MGHIQNETPVRNEELHAEIKLVVAINIEDDQTLQEASLLLERSYIEWGGRPAEISPECKHLGAVYSGNGKGGCLKFLRAMAAYFLLGDTRFDGLKKIVDCLDNFTEESDWNKNLAKLGGIRSVPGKSAKFHARIADLFHSTASLLSINEGVLKKENVRLVFVNSSTPDQPIQTSEQLTRALISSIDATRGDFRPSVILDPATQSPPREDQSNSARVWPPVEIGDLPSPTAGAIAGIASPKGQREADENSLLPTPVARVQPRDEFGVLPAENATAEPDVSSQPTASNPGDSQAHLEDVTPNSNIPKLLKTIAEIWGEAQVSVRRLSRQQWAYIGIAIVLLTLLPLQFLRDPANPQPIPPARVWAVNAETQAMDPLVRQVFARDQSAADRHMDLFSTYEVDANLGDTLVRIHEELKSRSIRISPESVLADRNRLIAESQASPLHSNIVSQIFTLAGTWSLDAGDSETAHTLAREAVSVRPGSDDALRLLFQIYKYQANAAFAEREYSDALEIVATGIDLAVMQAAALKEGSSPWFWWQERLHDSQYFHAVLSLQTGRRRDAQSAEATLHALRIALPADRQERLFGVTVMLALAETKYELGLVNEAIRTYNEVVESVSVEVSFAATPEEAEQLRCKLMALQGWADLSIAASLMDAAGLEAIRRKLQSVLTAEPSPIVARHPELLQQVEILRILDIKCWFQQWQNSVDAGKAELQLVLDSTRPIRVRLTRILSDYPDQASLRPAVVMALLVEGAALFELEKTAECLNRQATAIEVVEANASMGRFGQRMQILAASAHASRGMVLVVEPNGTNEAISHLEEGIHAVQSVDGCSTRGECQLLLSTMNQQLAILAERAGETPRAEDCISKALKHARSAMQMKPEGEQQKAAVAKSLAISARLYPPWEAAKSLAVLEEADGLFAALPARREYYSWKSELAAWSLQRHGQSLLNMDRCREAARVFATATPAISSVMPNPDLWLLDMKYWEARALMRCGEFENAIARRSEARKIVSSFKNLDSRLVAVEVCSDAEFEGDCLRQQGAFPEAAAQYEIAASRGSELLSADHKAELLSLADFCNAGGKVTLSEEFTAADRPLMLIWMMDEATRQADMEATAEVAKLLFETGATDGSTSYHAALGYGRCIKLLLGWSGTGEFMPIGRDTLDADKQAMFDEYRGSVIQSLRDSESKKYPQLKQAIVDRDLMPLWSDPEFIEIVTSADE